jgi:hypothetical protein
VLRHTALASAHVTSCASILRSGTLRSAAANESSGLSRSLGTRNRMSGLNNELENSRHGRREGELYVCGCKTAKWAAWFREVSLHRYLVSSVLSACKKHGGSPLLLRRQIRRSGPIGAITSNTELSRDHSTEPVTQSALHQMTTIFNARESKFGKCIRTFYLRRTQGWL